MFYYDLYSMYWATVSYSCGLVYQMFWLSVSFCLARDNKNISPQFVLQIFHKNDSVMLWIA